MRLGINSRTLPWATANFSYESARRSGDNYAFNPTALYYSSASLTNAPPTLADLRMYDIADRHQHVAKGRVNFSVAEDMDLAVSGRHLGNTYGAQYGRLADRSTSVNLEWSWQPRPRASAYAHYGLERRRNSMAQIADNPAGYATGNPNAGGPVYPLANRWDEQSRDDAHSIGLGFRYEFTRATLESGYTWHFSTTRARYDFASSGAIVGGAGAVPGAADGMPDTKYRQQMLETSLRFVINKDTALRLYHRYERVGTTDWHYEGLPLLFGNGAGVFLGATPLQYSVQIIGLFIQYVPGKQQR